VGWTTLHRKPGMSDREFFENEFPTTLVEHGEIVACSTVRNVFYAAVRNNDKAAYEPGKTWALVVLIQRTRGHYNFGYKEMDETMGPYESHAPAKVLDALSSTDNENAIAWRQDCRTNLAAKATRSKVQRGDTVIFDPPIAFTDGTTHSRMIFESHSTFASPETYLRYRVSNWRQHSYTVDAL
jgi:hypothetical protein